MDFQNLFYIEIMKYNENKYYTIFPGAVFLETLKDSSNQSFTMEGDKNFLKEEEFFLTPANAKVVLWSASSLIIIFFLQC